jgi:Fibronectin type III domain
LPSCFGASSSFSGPPALPPALSSDFDAGTLGYSDPFPSTWVRTFNVIQCAAVSIALPGSTSTQTFILSNIQSTPLPTAPVVPLMSPVQSPQINGADLFTAATINSTAVTLSWSPPAVGTPTGYQVQIESPVTLNSGSSAYSISVTFGTKKTSVTVPPSMLAANKTYVFLITATVDGQANMETNPHRSALPVASANVISAPITIGTGP